jgi:hypothetical protein
VLFGAAPGCALGALSGLGLAALCLPNVVPALPVVLPGGDVAAEALGSTLSVPATTHVTMSACGDSACMRRARGNSPLLDGSSAQGDSSGAMLHGSTDTACREDARRARLALDGLMRRPPPMARRAFGGGPASVSGGSSAA